jgi:hypothetical protein
MAWRIMAAPVCNRRAAKRAWYNWRVPPPVSGEIHEIVRSLFEERSLADRMRGRDRRPEYLDLAQRVA